MDWCETHKVGALSAQASTWRQGLSQAEAVQHTPEPRLRPYHSQLETIRSNVIGCLNLADICLQHEIHMTYYGTGCIFHYDDEHVIGGKGFTEADKPNFTGSYYSYTKVCAGIPAPTQDTHTAPQSARGSVER